MQTRNLVACLASLALVLAAELALVQATDYCSSELCPAGKVHIACNNTGDFLAKCPSNAVMVNLKPYIMKIQSMHNFKRNLIATGKFKNFKPASRMAPILWDDELASVAAYNVKQCQIKHDQCRNTDAFRKSGQNLALIAYTGSKKSTKYLVQSRVNAWFLEYKNTKMSHINSYPKNYKGPAIGHFTIFVADRNTRVGCAAASWKSGKWNKFLIACNYATTNIVGREVYKTSNTAGSGCTTGRNHKFSNLCSTRETYD